VPQAWNPQPWASPAATPGFTSYESVEVPLLDVPAAPVRKRRWLKRTLLSLVVLLVIGGLVGGSLAYVDHRREVQHKKEVAARLAAEKRAEAAYLAAVKPLAVRVFDVVQPIQDVYDSFGHRRPGYEFARDDVIQHGGALRELKAVKLAVSRLTAPPVFAERQDGMLRQLDRLVAAVTALEKSTHERGNSFGLIPSFGPRFQEFQTAAAIWSATLRPLDALQVWPLPSEKRELAHGRKAATVGGFIVTSDYACGKASEALEFEDFKHVEKTLRSTFPKVSKQFRLLIPTLKAAPFPTKERPLRHRLELGWTSMGDVVTQMDAMTRAFKRHDVTAFKRAASRLDQAVDGMNDLALAYRSVGATACYDLLVVDDGKKGSSTSRT
jgi:hypothetical protein